MRRVWWAVWSILFLAVAAMAQSTQATQPQKSRPGGDSPGAGRVRWVAKQFDLDQEQRAHFESLYEIYLTAVEREQIDVRDFLEQAAILGDEIKKAQAAGDQERVRALREQAEKLLPSKAAEQELYDGLEPVLWAQQRELLARLRARLATNSDISLNPREVLGLPQQYGLNEEQKKKLAEVERAFAAAQQRVRSRPRVDEAERKAPIEQLVKDVRAVLTPEQAARFDREIDKLRPPDDSPAGGVPMLPGPTTTRPTSRPGTQPSP